LLAVLFAVSSSIAAAEEPLDEHDVRRDGSAYNLNFHNNGVDDYRVDANIALLDKGSPAEVEGVNLVHRTNCVNPDPWRESLKEYTPPNPEVVEDPKKWWPDPRLNESGKKTPYGCLENSGEPLSGQGIPEGRMKRAAEIDGTRGLGGVAPGARIWSVRVLARSENFGVYPNPKSDPENPEYDPEAPEYLPELGTAHVIAGLDWVTATREDKDPSNDIDVAEMAISCAQKGNPEIEEEGLDDIACDSAKLSEAINAAVDKGIVVVAVAGNGSRDASVQVPQSIPDVFTVSSVNDTDGKPGGEGPPCNNGIHDDQRTGISNYGLFVDIAASPHCGDTSGAMGKIAGAAAALASQCPAHNRAGVEFVEDTLMAEGDTGSIKEGGWEDDSGDGWKEPLLNLSSEAVFNPVQENTKTHELNHAPSENCPWLSHQAESDVGSDGRADLVTITSQGSAKVYAGTPGGYETTNPVTSLKGQLDPALRDGKGEYAIDSADVNGDRHADLVTVKGGQGVYVYPGNGEGGFGAPIQSQKGMTLSFDGSEGKIEPIAAADVNGDGRADLIAKLGGTSPGVLLTFPGQSDGTFGEAIASNPGTDSALLDGKGEYFLDAIDVTGDGLADLVTSNTNGTAYLYKGRSDGKFEAKIAAASLNPIMDDGKGEEIVGLGDVNRDHRADLLTLSGETLELRKAKSDGTFEEPVVAYAGKVDSSLLDGKGQELIGLQDYSRDGLADLVAVSEAGKVLTYAAQRNFTFAAPVESAGSIPSVRQSTQGSEFLAEKPFLRRVGCKSTGCAWQPPLHAPRFDADVYPATLKGAGLKTFTTKAGPIECEETSLSGQASAPTTQLALSATYNKCKAFGLTATVTMNSCHYNLGAKNAGPPYKGAWAVACEKEGEAIEYKAYTSKGALVCTAKVAPQAGLEGISLTDTGEGSTRGIEVSAEVKSVKYELIGSSCGSTGTFTDGVMKGTTTLTGANEKGEQAGIYLTGKELPQLEAEAYPATLKGTGLKTFTTKSGPIECEEASLSGTASQATTQQALAATYNKCKAFGLTATVTMNSCHYNLGVKDEGPPYKGSWDVACEKEGEAIEFKALTSKGVLVCTAKVFPQAGLEGVSLANTGEGSKRAISLEAEVKGVKYEMSGSTCGGTATYTDGVFKGSTTLSGTNEKAVQIGVYLGGKA
jgi:hypothetical protein